MRKNVLIGPIIVILIWFLISKLNLIDKFFLPDPFTTLKELFSLIFNGVIIQDILLTVKRTILAFIISIIIGLPLGLILGSSRKLYESFEFVIDFFRSIPATAMFPLFLLVFGIEDKSNVIFYYIRSFKIFSLISAI